MLRKHFNATTIIAIVALVFAMTGGAYAVAGKGGNGSSVASIAKKKGKRHRSKVKSLRGPAGPEGKQGPAGPVGPQGPAGANGKDGTNGVNGKDGTNGVNGKDGINGTNGKSVVVASFAGTSEPASAPCAKAGGEELEVEGSSTPSYVCNGSAATASACLESKKSETGQWAVGKQVVTAEELKNRYVPVSFSIPLCSGVTVTPHFVTLAQSQTNPPSPPAGCKGSFLKPEAEPGNLCVFATREEGFAFASFESAETQGPTVKGSGVLVVLKATAEELKGKANAIGDWVVTAP